jgi:hypothetical protein
MYNEYSKDALIFVARSILGLENVITLIMDVSAAPFCKRAG